MKIEEIKESIPSLIYYLKQYNKKGKDLDSLIEEIKIRVLSSNLIRNRNLVKLFQEYTLEKIKKSLENGHKKNRYYTFEIVSKLVAEEDNL